jgi:hypothetical protein
MRNCAVLLAVSVLSGCGYWEASQHLSNWQQRIATEVPVGTSRLELGHWAEANGLRPAQKGRDFAATVHTAKGDGFFCSKVSVVVVIALNSADRVIESKVIKACTLANDS